MDAYSTGVSSEAISKKLNGKWVAIATTVIGTIGAIFYPVENVTDFLYLIVSMFAPMIAVLISDYFIIKQDLSSKNVYVINIIVWLTGFIVYRYLMTIDIVIGNSLPSMLITIIICIVIHKIKGVLITD